jgi:hypothetical protein
VVAVDSELALQETEPPPHQTKKGAFSAPSNPNFNQETNDQS